MPLWKKNFISNTPWGVCMYLLFTTRLTVDSCMPMSLATSRSTSGRKYSIPWSRNSRWKLMMLVATLWIVFCRWSTDLIGPRAALVEQPPVDGADPQLRQPFLVQRRNILVLDLDDVDVGDDVLRLARVVAVARLRIEAADDLDVLLEVLDVHPELAGDLRHLVVLQELQVFGDDLLGWRPLEPEVPDLQPEAFLQVARGHADRIERLHVLQRTLDVPHRPVPHCRDLLDRGHEVAVVVQVADDRAADLLHPVVVGLHRQLPGQVVGQRSRRRQRVLDRRQLLDFGRRPRPVAVVQIVAEEVLVIRVVPG